MNEGPKVKLAKRQLSLVNDKANINLANIPNFLKPDNPLSLNHTIKYANQIDLIPNNQNDQTDFLNSDYLGERQLATDLDNNYPTTSSNQEQFINASVYEMNLDLNTIQSSFSVNSLNGDSNELNLDHLLNSDQLNNGYWMPKA